MKIQCIARRVDNILDVDVITDRGTIAKNLNWRIFVLVKRILRKSNNRVT